jgi:hypothetical protein
VLKSPLAWTAALWLGVMIHVDWHLGRSGHDHRSFDLAYHWLVAIPTFAPVAWLVLRRWPASALRSGTVILVLGVIMGQGLEPVAEAILFQAGIDPFANHERWRVFFEFMAAGLMTLLGTIVIGRWRLRSSQAGNASHAGGRASRS